MHYTILTMSLINLANKSKNLFNAGFIRLVDCMPRVVNSELKCDEAIVQAARVSFGQGMKDYDTDAKLIRYLLRHKHTSPFEMVKFKFHVKAPIFIQRQWFRHRMSSFNEISGRYSTLNPEFYVPYIVGKQSTLNKQSSTDENLLNNKVIKNLFNEYLDNSKKQYRLYENLIKHGASKEISRICLPLNMYTEFYWSIDLHNLFNFLRLRDAPNAQYEIQAYARATSDLIKELCPISYDAYEDYIKNSITLSEPDILYLNGEKESINLREQKELKEKIVHINNGKLF